MENTKHINNDTLIDFKELFKVIWQGKLLIFIFITLFSLAGIIYSLSLPNIYNSKSLLNPVIGNVGTNQALKSYQGIASIAGINLPSSSNEGNTVMAIEKLKTLSFFEENILPNIYLPNLMAIDRWDSAANKVIYNKKIFNENSENWIRDPKKFKTSTPSAQESFRVFKKHLQVSEDANTGFISVIIKHQSPYIAKKWNELIVEQLNEFFRVKDKLESQAAMNFLNTQIQKTSFSEIKQVIAQLLQQKMQQLTLIEVSDFYVFEYIDPPAVMEKKSDPKRSIICIFSALFGAIFGFFIVIIRFYSFD